MQSHRPLQFLYTNSQVDWPLYVTKSRSNIVSWCTRFSASCKLIRKVEGDLNPQLSIRGESVLTIWAILRFNLRESQPLDVRFQIDMAATHCKKHCIDLWNIPCIKIQEAASWSSLQSWRCLNQKETMPSTRVIMMTKWSFDHWMVLPKNKHRAWNS